MPAVEFIGIDVHKRGSQVCILAAEREVVEKRISTKRGRFAELLGGRPCARILIESSTESEGVAKILKGLGHEVAVADPNFSPMYATRSRRVKTDKRDARTIAEACKLGRTSRRTAPRIHATICVHGWPCTRRWCAPGRVTSASCVRW